MAEQASGTVQGTGTAGTLAHAEEGHHGKPMSWVAVSVIVVGFVIGGIAIVGCIMTLFAKTFDDWY